MGTALSGSSLVWYTVAGGIITEVYHPDVDTPQIRDLQLLVTDGKSFFHDGTRSYNNTCELIDPEALGLRLTKAAIGQPYKLIQEVIGEPGSSSLLIRTRLEGERSFLSGLNVYVLLAPHLEGFGAGNSGFVARTARGDKLVAHRGNSWLAIDVDCGFRRTSCGFCGVNDGWQDIVGNRRPPIWNFDSALNGNIALLGEVNLEGKTEFMLALSFGEGDANTPNGALVALSEALSYPFEAPPGRYSHLDSFLAGWKNSHAPTRFIPKPQTTFDQDKLFHQSRNVLLAHEDKIYNGALVASLSIPWGASQGDSDGGYHLVWPRDMTQSATALLAAGDVDLPLRGLMYLAASQAPDGSFYQRFYINGNKAGDCLQLDEFSFPIILAYRMSLAGALQNFDPRPMVLAAAGAVIANGPMTRQERWEENEGYSPSTLAANIASLVCAAKLTEAQDPATAQFLLEYADFLESHVETWTVTTKGSLLPGVSRHYIRMLPTFVKSGTRNPTAPEDPDSAVINIANGGGSYPAKDIVDAGFLELVRFGIRPPGDPLIRDSLKVVDAVLRDELPGGPCFRRYNHDGYGQKADGGPFDGTGIGRPWPLLTGERALYEFAAGQDTTVYLKALEAFAGQHGLLAEQLWNTHDLGSLILGGPSGSAVPLAWAHAEYLKLVRSISDGTRFDLIKIVADRYLPPHIPSSLEVWNFDRQIQSIPRGNRLRIPLNNKFRLRWSADGWKTTNDTLATSTNVGIYYVDIPTDHTTAGPLIFTFYWINAERWEGVNFEVRLS